MIQDGSRQGWIFNRPSTFGESVGHDDPRSLFLKSLHDFKGNERFILGDEDKAPRE